MPGKQSTGCHQVTAEVLLVAGRQWRGVLKVSRPAMCTTPCICTMLPPACLKPAMAQCTCLQCMPTCSAWLPVTSRWAERKRQLWGPLALSLLPCMSEALVVSSNVNVVAESHQRCIEQQPCPGDNL